MNFKNENLKSKGALSFVRVLTLGVVALTLTTLSACGGVGSQEDSSAAQINRDNEKILKKFTLASGTYSGQISNASTGFSPTDATLFMYSVPIVDGRLSDGSPKIRYELRARFRLDKVPTLTDFTTMVGDYSDAGVLSFAPPSDVNPISLHGQLLDGKITVDVTHQGGVWGTFIGTQSSNSASAPAEGDVREEYERYRALYHEVEGTYTAVLMTPDGKQVKNPNNQPLGVEIVISQKPVQTVTSSGTYLLPALAAHYRRTDVIPGEGIGEYNLTVDYDGLTFDTVMQSVSPDKAIPGSSQILVDGHIIDHVLRARVSDKTGYIGDFIATAKKIPPVGTPKKNK